MKNLNRYSVPAVALSALVFSGCPHVGPDYVAANRAWALGDIESAASELQKGAEPETVAKADEPLLWMLDAGLVSGLTGDYAAGTHYLQYAREEVESGLMRGEDRGIVDAAISGVSGKYECAAYEAMMIPALQIYNALGGNDKNDVYASVRAIDVFSMNVRDAFAKRMLDREIAASKRKSVELKDEKGSVIKNGNGSYCPMDEVRDAVNWKAFYGSGDAELAGRFDRADSEWLFLSPFPYWLGAAVAMNAPRDVDDLDLAKTYLENAARLTEEESDFLAKELETLDKARANPDAALESSPNITYVIYEGGRAPVVSGKPTEIRVPIVVRSIAESLLAGLSQLGDARNVLPTSGTAFLPVCVSRGKVPEIEINGKKPEQLIDFDRVLDDTLYYEMPAVASDAVVRVSAAYIVRAGLLIGAGILKQNAAQNPGSKIAQIQAEAALRTAISVASKPIEFNRPDSRSWSFLPRTLSVARFATPRSGKLEICGETVSVPARGVNFVRVRKVDEYWPATVQVFPLDPSSREIVPTARLRAKPRPGQNP